MLQLVPMGVCAWTLPLAPGRVRQFGTVVPGAHHGTYFQFTVPTGGVWWSRTFTLGALVGSMLARLGTHAARGRLQRVPYG